MISPLGSVSKQISLPHKVLQLALPFGKRKLAFVFAVVLLQGLLQVVGVTSVFPFLALVADPQRIYNSTFGRWFLSFLPEMSLNELLIIAGLFAITMMVVSNVINIVGEFVRNRYAHEFGHWLRLNLLNRMTARDYDFFLTVNSGVLVKKIYSDVLEYVNGVLLPLLDSSARIVTSLLLILALLFIHLEIALIAAFGLGICYFWIYFALKNRRNRITAELKLATRLSMIELQHLFGAIKPIKLHQTQQYFINRFSEPSAQHAKNFAWLPVYIHLPRYVIEPLAFGGIILLAIYFISAGRNVSEVLPNMGVMALAGYKLLPNLQLLYGQITKISATRYALDEVYEEFSREPALQDLDIEIDTNRSLVWNSRLELRDVTFRYPDALTPVLDSISLCIEMGSKVGFVGPTGAGKSTLVDLILGLHQPQSGEILVDGISIGPANLKAWQRQIGYVPQEVFLIDDTVASNIALGIDESRIDMDRLFLVCKTAQILDFIHNELPQAFETVVGERGIRLSGGQRQRIGLARALYHDPELLIFDEATSALDQRTEADLMAAIDQISNEKTIILVAHRISTVQNCHQIYMFKNGSVGLTDLDKLQSNFRMVYSCS